MVLKPLLFRNAFLFKKLPETDKIFLEKEVYYYKLLTDSEKRVFEHRVVKFIDKHEFFGQGISIDNRMKLLISAMAIQLTFGMKNYLYSLFHTIIIYPQIYESSITHQLHKGEANPKLGVLVFSWEDFKEGIRIDNDNLNLGLHEFTHALHFSFIKKRNREANRFLKNYKDLLKICTSDFIVQMKKDGYLRPYAYENTYELLSVLVECFFETPKDLKKHYPSIYLQLTKMLNQDYLQ